MFKKKIPFDNFAVPIEGFNLEGQSSSKSWFGFTSTLILLTTVTVFFLTGVISMFQRQSMSVSISEEGLPNPPPTNIKAATMAFAMNQRSQPLIGLTYGTDFNIVAGSRTLTFYGANPRKLDIKIKPLVVKQCDREYFGELADDFEKIGNLDDMYCIQRDQADELFTLQGQMGSDYFKDIQLAFNCGARGATSCPGTFSSSNILFYYAASYLDSSNYENPVMRVPVGLVDRADINSFHDKTIYITVRDIVTDVGLVFEDKRTQTDLMVSDGQSVTEGVNPMIPALFTFSIRMNSKKVVVNRSYVKIYDVLATTTGIASTIALVFGFLIKPYVELKTYDNILKKTHPKDYVELSFKDYVRGVIFRRKDAKEKVAKVKKGQDWVIGNLDVVKKMKDGQDLEKIKKVMMIEEQEVLQEQDLDVSAFSSVKLAAVTPVRETPVNDAPLESNDKMLR